MSLFEKLLKSKRTSGDEAYITYALSTIGEENIDKSGLRKLSFVRSLVISIDWQDGVLLSQAINRCPWELKDIVDSYPLTMADIKEKLRFWGISEQEVIKKQDWIDFIIYK